MPVAKKRGPKSSLGTEHAREFKDWVMRCAFDMPGAPVTPEDLREIAAAERKLQKESVSQRIRAIAAAFNRSEKTVRGWQVEGLNVHDMIEVCRFIEWKDARAKNRRHLDGLPRRIRSPFD